MIPVIIIDTQDIMSQYTSLTKEDVDNMLNNIAKGLAASFAQHLEERATQELHQTRKRYLQNIRVVDSGKLEGTVLLDYSKDPLVKMIEEGADAFDMKTAMLASAKVKIGKKGGKYLTIPFRWANPNAVADEDVFVGRMPNAVYNVVKSKPTDIPVSGGGSRSSGLALKDVPEQFQIKKVRKAIVDEQGNERFKEYQHKNSVYEGIVKQKDSVTSQNTYHSFRRVSENSEDEAWIHPGIEKYNLIQKTLSNFRVEDELGAQLDEQLNRLGLI